jgi:signal peptidase I
MAEFSKSMFPVFFIVLIIRSFIVEPYRIPSPSMLPTLQIGDMIMVNKFAYGLKLPLWDYEWVKIGKPKRGDIVVLHYPVDPNRYYIKRVIGVPGDMMSYENKELIINGQRMEQKFNKRLVQTEEAGNELLTEHEETLGDVRHDILRMPSQKAVDFVGLKVPEGQYFVMGDNRDNSSDSRYWGFVPEAVIVGTPILIFFSIDFDAKDIRWPRVGQLVS